jgi:hypothetical protein
MDQGRVVSALALLSKINKAGYKAVICGGYVRDTICDKLIRDIDLYVAEGDFNGVHLMLSGTHAFTELLGEDTPEYQHQNITQQVEFGLLAEHVGELPTETVNLIGLRHHEDKTLNVENVTRKFNLGICQAGIQLDRGKIIIGDEFRRDYKDKQITLYRTDWGYEASLKQFIKLQEKYPWPLRIHKEEGLFDAV